MRRKKKKTTKYRGHRTHGKGNVKNKRGAGNKGGRRNAGLHKHKYSWTVKYDPERFLRVGFVNPTRKKIMVMNLWEIENKIKNGELKGKDNKYSLTFDGKILGCGTLSYAVDIKALAWSKKAEEKIKAAGGSIEKLGEDSD